MPKGCDLLWGFVMIAYGFADSVIVNVDTNSSFRPFRQLSNQKLIHQGQFNDQRDGQIYPLIEIGAYRLMTRNLDFKSKGSFCNDNRLANCQKYGRLYSLKSAINACPKTWYLPTDSDWVAIEIQFQDRDLPDRSWYGDGAEKLLN